MFCNFYKRVRCSPDCSTPTLLVRRRIDVVGGTICMCLWEQQGTHRYSCRAAFIARANVLEPLDDCGLMTGLATTVAIDRLFAPAQRERIFRPFVSGDSHGTGLGLPIARELARALGGRVELDSEVGKGSRFRLVLPSRMG